MVSSVFNFRNITNGGSAVLSYNCSVCTWRMFCLIFRDMSGLLRRLSTHSRIPCQNACSLHTIKRQVSPFQTLPVKGISRVLFTFGRLWWNTVCCIKNQPHLVVHVDVGLDYRCVHSFDAFDVIVRLTVGLFVCWKQQYHRREFLIY